MFRAALAGAFTAILLSAVAMVADAADRTTVLKVSNVSCATCGPIVKRALLRVAGVSSVNVVESGTTATATVVYDDGVADASALVAATANAGFPSRVVQ